MRSRKGVNLRPTMERNELYQEVLELRKSGLSYGQIIKDVEEKHGVRLNKSHVSGWVNGRHRPFGSVREFTPTPVPELAYVIGVRMGDASMSDNRNHSHKIRLRVIDKEFAEEFSRCLSVILRRSLPRVRWDSKKLLWHCEVSSLLLCRYLSVEFEGMKKAIEHCEACASGFLRGFFDSEGWVSSRDMGVVNTDKSVLVYCQDLLERHFSVSTIGPRLTSKGGRFVLIKGKWYHANKDCYGIKVARQSFADFERSVGFTIIRKSSKLRDLAATRD